MIRALYSAASGMITQQRNMDTIADNISNVNTTAFKKNRAVFEELLYVTEEKPGGGNQNVNLQMGSGSRVSAISRSFTQGQLSQTDRKLDFAIQGDGFFTVMNRQGEVLYTRDGSFHISMENGEQVLVTARGEYVMDSRDPRQKIVLQGNLEDLRVEEDGQIYIGDQNSGFRLGLTKFNNPGALEAVGHNLYRETNASARVMTEAEFKVKQGYLEESNVELLQEMTRLIQAQRVYQLSSKAAQAADEMESMANNMRG